LTSSRLFAFRDVGLVGGGLHIQVTCLDFVTFTDRLELFNEKLSAAGHKGTVTTDY
jgi:hypothetical protein